MSPVKESLKIPCAVNSKLICLKKNKKILVKHLEINQTHYTEASSDEDAIIDSFLSMSVDQDANTVNRTDCIKCSSKLKNKSLANVTMASPKPSRDIRTFLKRTEN